MRTVAPYGSWRSPISAQSLVEQAVRLSNALVDGDDIYWNEMRPSEGGRNALVRLVAGGHVADAIPREFANRTLVHEYGGLAYAVRGGTIVFSNFTDQRLWRAGGDDQATPVPLTPEPRTPMADRFADPVIDPSGQWILCVRERHGIADEAVNDIVAVRSDGSGEIEVVAEGHDFFAAPRLSPDGNRVAWVCWDHPNMPWDATELWVADVDSSGAFAISNAKRVAGGERESVGQPKWSPDGRLHYMSDRTGWWNLYRDDGTALIPREAEFAGPDWAFGQSSYAFLADGSIAVVWFEGGRSNLGVLAREELTRVEVPFTAFSSLAPIDIGVIAIAGSPTESSAVVRIELPGGEVDVLKRSRERAVDATYVSVPRAIEFPTENGLTAHALFYPPANADFRAPDGERPPLIVQSHGGPTGRTDSVLDMGRQYWTSRGFAVVDVNYGGSTGYGRDYRERLKGAWGIVDVDDCVNAARWLAEQGEVDGARMVIRGGSAGGYTTLAALTFRDVFAAGGSHFGVADLAALATDTHKFESRYLDGLVGPYPDAKDVYDARSPIRHTDSLSTPMILFQGLEDKVVPPDQAEMMADALRAKGIPFAYLAFEGEQHGFRKADTIVRVAQSELSFYGRVLGFFPGDEIEPVKIENADALT